MILTRTREDFIKRYDNLKTQNQIRISLKVFDQFLKHIQISEPDLMQQIKNLDQGNNQEQLQPYFILDHMVQYWKRKKGAKTITNYFNFVKLWWRYQGVRLELDLIKEFVKFPKEIQERPRPIDKEIIKKLLSKCDLPHKAFFLVALSSSMRQGEQLQLRVRDFDFSTDPVKITIPGEFTKGNTERITFITPEAAKIVKETIGFTPPQDRVWSFDQNSLQKYMGRLRKQCGFTEKMKNGKFYQVRLHKTRGFGFTNTAKGTGDPEFSHAIMGHGQYLKNYYGQSDEEMAKQYKKAIPDLTIF